MTKKKIKTDDVIIDKFVDEITQIIQEKKEIESIRGSLKSLINNKIKYGKFVII